MKNVFIEENWTVLKEIIWKLWIVFSIGFGIYIFICIFNIFFGYFHLGFRTFLSFQLITFIIALFPLAALTILKEYRLLKKHIKAAKRISDALRETKSHAHESEPGVNAQKVVLASESDAKQYEFDARSMLYISAEGNYVNVVFMSSRIESTLIRNTLKNIELQLQDNPLFFRCHRAFIVNIGKITEAEGNAQGVRLTLEGIERKITVSRSYYKDFKQIMGIA